MNIFRAYKDVVANSVNALLKEGAIAGALDMSRITVELPREAGHGDMATNAAMVLSKQVGKNPRELGQLIANDLKKRNDSIASAEVAGPGFINFKLTSESWIGAVKDILASGTAYGASDMGKSAAVNVEFVSANPTGPMHAGHVRGAVIGDTLANLMAKAGYKVTREYYFNDAGTQVDVLARTVHLRYREALGETLTEIPEGLYPGEYLKDVAQALAKRDGNKWIGKGEEEWLVPIRTFAVDTMIAMIRKDLDLIGIHHDVFTNEREIVENGTLEACFKILEDRDLIYTGTLPPPRGKVMEDWEPTPLVLFRSSKFGDASDRPLKKRDGTWAYIMPDMAYHYDKIKRGFTSMINVLGTDHGSYLEKMRPAVAALSDNKAKIDVIFNGMVKVLKNGVPVKFSKRSGNIITLREMCEEVGADSVRFFILLRTPESELEFDFAKVVEQSKDNPVFYVQYAHARSCSVFRNAKEMFPALDVSGKALQGANLKRLSSTEEIDVIRLLASWPRILEAAAEAREPHRIAFYLYDVAAAFHAFWNFGRDNSEFRFLHENDAELSLARLAFVKSVQTVIASGLEVLGVKPAEEMHA